ncbi:MAG: phage head-tail connector protein [Rhizobiales bacterium]|nr:phage head-tail connector protein [Hyphomicrobiales bacterium]
MLAPRLDTAPGSQPVSLIEAKAHMNVDFGDDDALITAMIESATALFDGWNGILNRALITQTWEQKFPCFNDAIRLAIDPVQSVTTIKYYDGSNVEQTLSGAVYALFADEVGGFITLNVDQSWPGIYSRIDAVTVTYNAGYGAASAVPAPIRQAILMLVGHYYENRETASGMSFEELPFSVAALIKPFRRITV